MDKSQVMVNLAQIPNCKITSPDKKKEKESSQTAYRCTVTDELLRVYIILRDTDHSLPALNLKITHNAFMGTTVYVQLPHCIFSLFLSEGETCCSSK